MQINQQLVRLNRVYITEKIKKVLRTLSECKPLFSERKPLFSKLKPSIYYPSKNYAGINQEINQVKLRIAKTFTRNWGIDWV